MTLRTWSAGTRIAVVIGFTAMFGVLSGAMPAAAHEADAGIVVEIDDQNVRVTAAVPFEQLGYEDTSGDGLIDDTELDAQNPTVSKTLVATVRSNVGIAIDGVHAPIIGAGVPGLNDSDESSSASEYLWLVLLTDPHDGDVTELVLDWAFDSPTTHVVLTHPDGAVTSELDTGRSVTFSLDAWSSATSFFALGIEHIQFGPDHLLFLLVLTLAVAGTSVTPGTAWRTVKLVTAFTIGHAVSLCLAYFDLISIPAGLVEPAISLSIVAAAILVIRNRASETRPWIAAAVGLVHGLGFASSLASLGVAASQRAVALAAFNIGIDVAQTAVVLVVLAALWCAGKVLTDRTVWVRIPTAAFAGAIGLAWTASRLANLQL
jgi:hypothetical protein